MKFTILASLICAATASHEHYLSLTAAAREESTIPSQTLSLPLGPTTSETIPIRYWVNDTMATDESPIMLQMGGEGTANGVNCNPDMIRNSAICVQIEHRFYGDSLPSSGGDNANFKEGLSVLQNLADTAAVLKRVQSDYSVSDLPRPVVNFGGSYSGATATWFRMAYPELTNGAISSSGVVNAVLEFTGFDNVVKSAIGTKCADDVDEVSRMVDTYFSNDQGNDIKMMFNSTNLIDTKLGDADFMYMLADGFSMIDQYGGKTELCDGVAKTSGEGFEGQEKVENMRDVLFAHFGNDFGQDCYYDSECLKKENNPDASGMMGSQNSRSWRFQKCNEVAYLQSRPEGGLRSELLTIGALKEQCDYVFGIQPEQGNEELNGRFGADRPDTKGASNVFSISYSDDPWKAASVTESLSESLPYCYTECDGCGHCGSGVQGSDKAICGDPQSAFVDQVVAQARFEGVFTDPNHPGTTRTIKVKVTGGEDEVSVVGFDLADDGSQENWGPLKATVDGTKITVDFSSKGGPSDLTGEWGQQGIIVWGDGNEWPKN
ncbi:hypothetical protein TrLO_g6 [Triparma laevis f. longispina]|uniref:Uncharacterized protein n=1 Tax=Triparma laevis f. longispina TaxID=1714387 RepID=A0A9W7EAP5_9STRA|nr:hypothetical protein TrLO_g6 [Triparma laevis f. longispina]